MADRSPVDPLGFQFAFLAPRLFRLALGALRLRFVLADALLPLCFGFADDNTVKPNAPAEFASAVAALAKEIGTADTTNRVRYLRPAC